MKVMFVGAPFANNSVNTYLTKGKWYDVIPQNIHFSTMKTTIGKLLIPDRYYVILNDYGQERRYKAEYFLTLQQLRDKNLTDLGI